MLGGLKIFEITGIVSILKKILLKYCIPGTIIPIPVIFKMYLANDNVLKSSTYC